MRWCKSATPPNSTLMLPGTTYDVVLELLEAGGKAGGIAHEVRVVSAHRMTREMVAYGEQAADRGLRVVIAGAGGAAHLPGMLAAVTPLPVIGVPVSLKNLDGMDSLLSIVQMPGGIPVATVGIDNAKNAGILAARIIGAADTKVSKKIEDQLSNLNSEAKAKGAQLNARRSTKTGF